MAGSRTPDEPAEPGNGPDRGESAEVPARDAAATATSPGAAADDVPAPVEGLEPRGNGSRRAGPRRSSDLPERPRHSRVYPVARDRRRALVYVAAALVVLLLGGAVAAFALRPGGGGAGTPQAVLATTCTRLDVVTATSFAPVLRAVSGPLREGKDCTDVRVTTMDGRAATTSDAVGQADIWIPDDVSWANIAPASVLAAGAPGAGDVLAVSPILMVTDPKTAATVRAAGSSWRGLAELTRRKGAVRLVVADPAASGDGLVAIGTLGEAVWKAEGMDASALELAAVVGVSRTVPGGELALPAAGEVGLVPEHSLVSTGLPSGDVVLTGADNTALMRYSWQPTSAGAARSGRLAAVAHLRAALDGPAARAAVAQAGLRLPDAATSPLDGVPPTSAAPFDVLAKHHVEHVFASWYPADRRTDLLVVVDVSGSMARAAPGTGTALIDLVRDGLTGLVELLPPDARVGVWEFGTRLDGTSDHRELLPVAALDDGQRDRLVKAADTLRARRTGTGLYDTILDAYTAAVAGQRTGVPSQVIVFTDGRNEADPGSISAAELGRRLSRASDPNRPVALSVVAFGDRPEVTEVAAAVEPVSGHVDPIHVADQVAAVFVHVAAGGPHR